MSEKISWTKPKLEAFKRAHKRAKDNNLEQFVFEGKEFVTDFAKALIEYLETKLR